VGISSLSARILRQLPVFHGALAGGKIGKVGHVNTCQLEPFYEIMNRVFDLAFDRYE
jgi:hypothetical protein